MEKSIIEIFKKNNQKEISRLYYEYRASFYGFCKQYRILSDERADIYQEAFIAVRKLAINGKLDQVKSSYKTYLFGVGKFMIFNHLKEENKKTPFIASKHLKETIDPVPVNIDDAPLTPQQLLIKKHFNKLGKKCRELLTLFYYQGLIIDEIIETTDYSQSSVVRSQKSRCLKTLREMIKKNV